MKRTRVLSPCQAEAQNKRRCRTPEATSAGARRSTREVGTSLDVATTSQRRCLADRMTTPATEERLRLSHARLSAWEKDKRQFQAKEELSDATTENETETVSRRQRTLSNETAARMTSEAAAKGMNLLQLGAVGPQTRQNYAASLMKFEQWTNQQRRRIETDAEIDAAMSTWMEAEFYKKEVLRA